MKASPGSNCPGCIVLRFFLLLAACAMYTSCHAQSERSSQEKTEERYFLLGLVGYNYTDRDIDSYTVNGAGGGSIILSSPTSGGSGTSCCVKLLRKSSDAITVSVRWQVDGCTYLIKDGRTGKADKVRHSYFKEAEVNVNRGVSKNPGYIESHFYPDGSVQVQLTEYASGPRLKLDGNRADKSSYPRCKDDEKPEI